MLVCLYWGAQSPDKVLTLINDLPTQKDITMLIYDYVELREDLFLLITNGIKPYKTDKYKSYYKVKGQTIYKVSIDGLTQYYINSAHPV